MKVLIACEYSGTIRNEFTKLGHDVMSCDLLPTETEGNHYQGDVREVIHYPWDMIIAHPPCTNTSVSGARWFKEKRKTGAQQASVSFFLELWRHAQQHIEHAAFEHPVSIMSTLLRKPDQTIQPWQHGHGETKATCLWLKNLPPLEPSDVVDGRESRIYNLPPTDDRWKIRSKTYAGIAAAMAAQWGGQ